MGSNQYAKLGSIALITLFIISYQNCSDFSTNPEKILAFSPQPIMQLLSAPRLVANSISHQFQLGHVGSAQSQVSYLCRISSDSTYKPCSSSQVFSNLSDGVQEFQVKARNANGLESATLQYSWRQDTQLPVVSFTSTPPNQTSFHDARFAFVGTDNSGEISRFECSVNHGNWSVCTSPQSVSSLSDGTHFFEVRATDPAGNISLPVSYSWTVDSTAPSVRFTSLPAGYNNLSSISIAFSGSDAGSGAALPISSFECRTDLGVFVACNSPITLSGLADGGHTFYLRGRDTAGNYSKTISFNWYKDVVPPIITINSAPEGTIIVANNADPALDPQFSFTASDAGSGLRILTCQMDNSPEQACTNIKSYLDLNLGDHEFKVRATDNSGNSSTVTRKFKYIKN